MTPTSIRAALRLRPPDGSAAWEDAMVDAIMAMKGETMPTKEQVRTAVVAGFCKGNGDSPTSQMLNAITNTVMALLDPKPAPRRWIVEEDGTARDRIAVTGGFAYVRVVRELQAPSMAELMDAYERGDNGIHGPGGASATGIRAVLAACGLEVGKP